MRITNKVKSLIISVYVIVVVVLAIATIIEANLGTNFVTSKVYHSWWFILLWFILSVFGILAIIKYKLWRRLSIFLLHLSFLFILLGAAMTFFTGSRGYIQLREDTEGKSEYFSINNECKELPFSVKLIDFSIEYYEGTTTPSDYISIVSYDGAEPIKISMNNISRHKGYRFYQSSFDKDEKGSLLTISYDPFGIAITYFGYILLALSMLATLCSSSTEFRKLLSAPLLLIFTVFLSSCNKEIPDLTTITKAQADTVSMMPIKYNGRIAPFNTMAEDVLKKIYGKKEYKGLNAEQVISGWIIRPEQWKDEKLIEISNNKLERLLGIEGNYASVQDLYDGEKYKLELWWNAENQSNPLQKEIRKIDEKLSILVMLQKRTLFEPYHGAVNSKKIKAEKLYNRYNIVSLLFKLHLGLGMLAFFLFVYMQLSGRRIKFIKSLLAVQVIHSFCFLSLIIGLRWYVSGHFPVANGYGTMLFIAWIIILISLFFYRKYDFVPAASLLLSGFALLVCNLNSINPQITNLMPVLASPWLSSHVTSIMISYALFFFMFFNGILGLILHKKHEEMLKLQRISNILLYPAVFMLTAGIFIGAVWANVSWGRYWAWDPKEVWALITMMVYSLGLHKKSIKFLQDPKYFHIFTIFAFATVIMTYFGVNYLLGGLHSYNN